MTRRLPVLAQEIAPLGTPPQPSNAHPDGRAGAPRPPARPPPPAPARPPPPPHPAPPHPHLLCIPLRRCIVHGIRRTSCRTPSLLENSDDPQGHLRVRRPHRRQDVYDVRCQVGRAPSTCPRSRAGEHWVADLAKVRPAPPRPTPQPRFPRRRPSPPEDLAKNLNFFSISSDGRVDARRYGRSPSRSSSSSTANRLMQLEYEVETDYTDLMHRKRAPAPRAPTPPPPTTTRCRRPRRRLLLRFLRCPSTTTSSSWADPQAGQGAHPQVLATPAYQSQYLETYEGGALH